LPVEMNISPRAKGALIVVGGLGVGSALIAAAVWSGDPALSFGLFLIVPPLLGIFAATQAARRVSLLALAVAMFAAGAIAVWFAFGPGARAEGGAALIVFWLVPAELVTLIATDAVLRVSDRRRRGRGIPGGNWTGRRLS
jgi:hypothetical protein